MSFKLIKEFSNEIITEEKLEESSGKKNWIIKSVTLQADIKNGNGRIYPKKILSEAVNKHIKEYMDMDRAVGELNHPTGDNSIATINLEKISHKFIKVEEDGKNFITTAKVLNTPCGNIVSSLLEAGVKLGISSRGLGKIQKNEEGIAIVEQLHLISLGDIVANPSAPDAFVNGVLESIEFELVNDSFISKKIKDDKKDIYYKLIKENKSENISKALKTIISDYINIKLK